jgi:hypothetical protein
MNRSPSLFGEFLTQSISLLHSYWPYRSFARMVQVSTQQLSSHCLVVRRVRFMIFCPKIPRPNPLFVLLCLLFLAHLHQMVNIRMVLLLVRVVCVYELLALVVNYSLQFAHRQLHIPRMCENYLMSPAPLHLDNSGRCQNRLPSR